MLEKTIDFTKPLEVDKDFSHGDYHDATILAVIPVAYNNPHYRHAIHVREEDGIEDIVAVNNCGWAKSCLVFRNVAPSVRQEVWVNVYKDGSTGSNYSSRSLADSQLPRHHKRTGILHTIVFSDGSINQTYTPV